MKYGIPYMGSKSDIIKSIALNFPKATNFYDLFGGGFCVTHYMLMHKSHLYKSFHYNEIKSDVVDLVKQAIGGKFNYATYKPPWVSREDFFAKKNTDAYARLIWSFGNNQTNYLFGQDIEQYKKALHMAVIFDDFSHGADKILQIDKWPLECKTILQKRYYVRQKVAHLNKTKSKSELERLQQLQQLERLQQLQQLERLQQLQQLTFFSLSYDQVNVLPDSVVYCDPPYQGTADYIGKFDHQKFFDWAANAPFPVFISEYNISDKRLRIVYEVERKTKLSGKGATAHHSEKLYWNGK